MESFKWIFVGFLLPSYIKLIKLCGPGTTWCTVELLFTLARGFSICIYKLLPSYKMIFFLVERTTKEITYFYPFLLKFFVLQLMTEDLLQDLVLYKKSHEKAVSSAARSLISLFRGVLLSSILSFCVCVQIYLCFRLEG